MTLIAILKQKAPTLHLEGRGGSRKFYLRKSQLMLVLPDVRDMGFICPSGVLVAARVTPVTASTIWKLMLPREKLITVACIMAIIVTPELRST